MVKKQYQKNRDNNTYMDEVYIHFKIDLSKYHSFIDVCSNPNQHTLFILNANKSIKGTGISLQTNKGGYPEHKDLAKFASRYTVNYFDLLTDNLADLSLAKSDYIVIECFARHNVLVKEHNVKKFNTILQLSAIDVLVTYLKDGADALYLLPFHHDSLFLLNQLFLLDKMFESVKLFKSEISTPDLSIVYVNCIRYKSQFDRSLLKRIKSNEILFDKDFVARSIKDIDYVFEKINIGTIKSIKQEHISKSTVPNIPTNLDYD